MPKPTPQTATRKIRSQSPPRATQRRPVIAIAAAIPSSSIRPYMWIVSGPSSSVPEDGEGIEARSGTGRGILPARLPRRWNERLEQDLQGELGLATAAEEIRRVMQVDIHPARQEHGGGSLVARPLELLGAP